MSQVILTGRLESIEEPWQLEDGDEAIFRERMMADEDKYVWVRISHSYSHLRIRTTEGKEAQVKFLNEVPDSYIGKDVMYVHDGGRNQLLMTGKLFEDQHNLGILLKSPEKHSLILRILDDTPAPARIEAKVPAYFSQLSPEVFYKIQ